VFSGLKALVVRKKIRIFAPEIAHDMDEKLIQSIKQRYKIVGNCDALNRAIDVALKIAPVDLSVLITGENGVGKEVFPRIIHDNSLRKTKKYFAVNCGAIPEGTIDSELFGHEKGAFTGAVEKREGYFAVANGGTLFLDEVGELPLATQARLLRVLETGEFISVGSSVVKKTDVRIVAATNVDVEQAIADGRFREDLYYRLNSVSINIPPLRERGNDAVLLFKMFALEMAEKYQMPAVRLTPEAEVALVKYAWPGNVRQLRNVAESMSVMEEDRTITPDILARYLPSQPRHDYLVPTAPAGQAHSFENEREILYKILFDLRRDVSELKQALKDKLSPEAHNAPAVAPISVFPHADAPDDAEPYAEAEELADEAAAPAASAADGPILSLDEQEKELITRTLQKTGGKRKAAAAALGISERTLYRKIHEYGLEDA